MKALLAFAIGMVMLVLAVTVTGMETYSGFQDINWDEYIASLDSKISFNPIQNPVAIKEPEFQVPDLPGLPTGSDAPKMPDISKWYTMPNQPVPPMEIPQIEIPTAIITQPEPPMPTKLPTSGTSEETYMAFMAQMWLAESLGVPITSIEVTEVTRGGCFSACPPDAEACIMVCVEGYIITFNVEGETYKVATNGDEFLFVEGVV